MVSFATISGDVGLTAPTVEKYISYFERSFLIFMLPNYAPREEAVQRRGRKLYFVDGAVRNAALQRGILPVENPAEMGALLENLAASHLHALCQQEGIRLFHWRQGPLEVDLVYDHPDNPMAFGIASSAGHDVAPLRAFQERYPRFAGRCFLVSPDAITALPERRGDGITIGRLPLDLFLICVGMQAAAAMNRKLAVPGSSR
jgi:predicted AAA+ superfamily ATPase